MPLAMTTELNAVNTILSAVGEPPVTTLDSQTNADAAIAQNILEEVNREVQTMGWHFNTQHDVEFSPNSDNLIVLPDDVVRIDVDPRIKKATEVGTVSSQTDNRDITQRGTELFDRTNNTNQFTKSVKVTVVYLLEFTKLPEAARRYITVKASRVFQDRMVGSQKHHAFSQADEIRALALMKEFEMDTADHTIFDNFDTMRIVNRGDAQRGIV
jgi:hypothetical protein|tara:strand:+ start:243 stop:881 length:639 start_codon:yes stop_codon:yes gene_type:complete